MIFIFGSNGMLGRYVTSYLSNSFEVTPLTRKDFNIINESINSLETLLTNSHINQNDIIMNCAGMIPQRNNSCEKEYLKINTVFPLWLSILAAKYNCKVIHITTDCVFSGEKGNYTELDNHDADYMYGVSKSLAENDSICIIRTSIIGEELENKMSLLEWVKSQNGKMINGYTNHYWNGVTCLELAKVIVKIIDDGSYWYGVRHIYSPNTVSKAELVKMIIEIYDLNIIVNDYEADTKIDRSLSSVYNNFDIKELYKQIVDMKKYRML